MQAANVAKVLFALVLCVAGSRASAFDIVNRWTATQTDGGGIERGDAITLRWSLVPDGVTYGRVPNAPGSDLIGFLDDQWNVPQANRTPDYTDRSWFPLIQDAYDQYGYVSGLTMVYVPEANANGGSTGQVGDIRVGGEPFGAGGVIADNTFPNDGDMRIDTTETPFYHPGNAQGLTNTISHESGHGVGLGHSDIQDADAVMEGGLQTHFFGLQFDDIYAFNRLYGDPREKGGGNDSLATSSNLGILAPNTSVTWGVDADDSVVAKGESDWLGIDGASDQDWFRFSIPQTSVADIRVTPLGPTYRQSGQTFNADQQSNLRLGLYRSNGTLVSESIAGGLGEAERVPAQTLLEPGNYYVRVLGEEDSNQFYQLDVEVESPELIVTVDRGTGAVTLSGLTAQGVAFDGYRIESPSGSLSPAEGAWASLQDQGEPGWREANPTSSSVQELLSSGVAQLSDSDSVHLGNFYSQILTSPLGTIEQGDIAFSYLTPGTEGTWKKGAVQFVGDPFYNNLVLTVDPSTGRAVLANESGTAIEFDGYSLLSDSNSLVPDGWTSLDDQALSDWREANPNQSALRELKPTGATTLLPGESLELGFLFDIGGTEDIELLFLLEGDVDYRSGWVVYDALAGPGDYDQDGDVDQNDYLVWRQSYGSTEHLAADGNHDGVVDASDYAVWRENLTTSQGQSTAMESVPAPSGIGILLASFVTLVRGCRRQRLV